MTALGAHRPALTAPPAEATPSIDATPNRALILAGGGMRVAYQAGVLRAVEEAGITFHHFDGTSGGIINLGMLFSGVAPEEMCRRWRSLNVRKFVSLPPARRFLRATRMAAVGDARGIVQQVFPHLGIDPSRINAAAGGTATFNVCNFTDKTIEAIPHDRVTRDLLVAGISLPVLMPAVRVGDVTYTDAVWIKDANLLEAVRRGAEELWLVWCIGNTPAFRDGALNQYVHMIEMSANGSLFDEFAQIQVLNEEIEAGRSRYGQRRPVRLHVIKPALPLPLDPDLYLGHIDNATLIDMGYRDASTYLRTRSEAGVRFTPEATKMTEPQLGITFRETMSGPFALGETDPRAGAEAGKRAGTNLAMHAAVEIDSIRAFVDDPEHPGSLAGRIDFTPWGEAIPAASGVFNLFAPTAQPDLKHMVYELQFQHAGQAYYLAGRKEVKSDSHGLDLWSDTTTLLTTLHEGDDASGPVVGAGVLSLGPDDLARLIKTVRVTGDPSALDRARTIATFGSFFMGELWDTYATPILQPASWWKRPFRWLRGLARQ